MPQAKQAGYREAKLQNWGNSKAVRLTKDILKEAGFNDSEGAVFEVVVEPNKISFVKQKELTPFQKLFDGYHGGKPDSERLWDEAEPVGKEDW